MGGGSRDRLRGYGSEKFCDGFDRIDEAVGRVPKRDKAVAKVKAPRTVVFRVHNDKSCANFLNRREDTPEGVHYKMIPDSLAPKGLANGQPTEQRGGNVRVAWKLFCDVFRNIRQIDGVSRKRIKTRDRVTVRSSYERGSDVLGHILSGLALQVAIERLDTARESLPVVLCGKWLRAKNRRGGRLGHMALTSRRYRRRAAFA